MPIRVEAYTATGVATGEVARTGPVREVLEGATDVVVERVPVAAARRVGRTRGR